MLQTKCIKSPIEMSDGYRISVMSRHTLNDGITPDHEITDNMYDSWLPELAPPAVLLGDYYKRDLSWDVFSARYKEHLNAPSIMDRVEWLGKIAVLIDVTLLCIENTPEQCHRRLLAEYCSVVVPNVKANL